MTWSGSFSGHCDTAEDETAVIEVLRTAAKGSGATTANVYTQHSGTINLLDEAVPAAVEDEPVQADSDHESETAGDGTAEG